MADDLILVIDNYDSFTWNLVHYVMELGARVEVVRNDALTAAQALETGAAGFLLSPGPCTPNEAGISLDLVGAAADAGRPLLADADALVPVPLHWRRQWARRFNQSALLAEVIANASGCKVAHGALKRVKSTHQQVGLDKSARAQNVQGAFRVPAEGRIEVLGRKLVLVDDVLTSGATVDVCARTLLRAGAASVDVVVFARVVATERVPI